MSNEQIQFDEILNFAGAGVFVLDTWNRMLRTNSAFYDRLLYRPEELQNKDALELIHSKDTSLVKEAITQLVKGQKQHFRQNIRYIRKDGLVLWSDLSLSAVKNKKGESRALVGIVIDISARKEAEEKLRRSEEKYRDVFEKSGSASIIIEPDMTVSMSNEEFEKLTGYSKREIEHNMTWSAFIAAEDLQVMKDYHRARRKPDCSAPKEYNCRLVNRAGAKREIIMKVGMLPDMQRSIASFLDITPLKQTENALKESKGKLSSIIEAAAGYIYTCDKNYRIEFMNKALIDKIGRDATGEQCYRAIYGVKSPCPWCKIEQAKQKQQVNQEIQDPLDNKWYYKVTSPVLNTENKISGFESLLIEITDKKKAEEKLKEREKYYRKENIRLKESIKERYKFGEIVGKSQPMQEIYELILNAASTDANVIIYGESGTGKELVANEIHKSSDRKQTRMVTVNCGAIPENLMESEFFGYKKGAFTGAKEDKKGYLDLADSGTLFLDELGEMDMNMQVKLLRLLEGRGYTPVGGTHPKHPHIRIIAATNTHPQELLQKGAMREDLFYRIHVIPVHLPALRERKEDLPLLIDHFLKRYQGAKNSWPITGEILQAMYSYSWPGNVRELENVIHRYLTLGSFDLEESRERKDTPPRTGNPSLFHLPLKEAVASFEKEKILDALKENHWHRGNTALQLGINRRTLFKKMQIYGLECSQNGHNRT